jgi:formate dehydrogenase major subunit
MCLIEVSKYQPLHPACTYKVSEGLAVETESERVQQARRFVLELIFSERNHYCMYCERSGNCELQDLGYRYGLDHWAYPTYTQAYTVDASRDTFLMDHNRCILCRRCVRACAELVANHTLGLRQRGAKTMITADLDVPFGDSSCVGCGTCLQVCPTGALIDKRSAYMDMGHGVEVERVKTTCSQCSVGCGIEIVLRGGNVIRVDGDWEAAPNGGVLCQKGRFEPLYDKRQRVTAPLVRTNGRLEEADWDRALAAVAAHLRQTPAEQVGIVTAAGVTNEALYLMRSIFHDGLGVTQAGLIGGAATRLDAPHMPLAQIPEADLVLVVGADPVETQPVVSFLVKRALDRGARLIVVDGEDNELGLLATMHFPMADFEQALDVVARADAPAILYGPGISSDDAVRLTRLERASFVALEPGANSRAARALGLNGGSTTPESDLAYVVLGEEPWPGDGDIDLLANAGYLVVQASYASPLTERADVVLPMATWTERAGSLTNLEGRVQQVRQAVAPQGQAQADWQILAGLGQALGQATPEVLADLTALAERELNGKENR